MEKAELIIELTKKKKLNAKLRFLESGKTITVSGFKPKDDTHNGKTVDVERENGPAVKVLLDSQVLFSAGKSGTEQVNKPGKDKKSKNFTGSGKDIAHLKDVSYPASAPYNFIPLNKKVVEISPESLRATRNHKGEEKSKSNRYHEDKLTGWIKLDIETKTPLYIRGTLNSEEIKKQQKAESNEKKYINSDFYSPNGRKQIPGSSLKGMIRNIMEITTYGKFEFFDDKTLYYRGLADKSNLRSEYQEKMSSYDSRAKKSIYTVSAGVLTREGLNYSITPSSYEPVILSESEKGEYKPMTFHRRNDGFLIVSGKMQNKKNDWIIRFPDKEAKKIPIPEMDVESYKGDTSRGSYIETTRGDRKKEYKVLNLIERADNKEKVPCFYVQWQDSLGKERVSFGHTPMFRLAYEKTIGDHVPLPGHRIDNETGEHTAIIDFVEAIFGNEKTFSGRVSFEDAFLNEGQGQVEMGKSIPEILSSPKPTTFQHYLTQTSDNSKELNHYNTEAPIRGYKLYWHKSGNNWQENNPTDVDPNKDLVDKKCQNTIVNPVKPGTRFSGKIRFENLSERELGSILFALSLPEGCCHKLGMGKPLGLGSVIIKPTLFLSNRKERYRNLFAEWGDNNPEPVDFKEYISKFEEYILEQIEPGIQSLWETERLKELKTILDYEIGKELESKGKTRYMKITPQNEFKNRSVLPLPSDLESFVPKKEVDAKEQISHIKRIKVTKLFNKFNIDLELDPEVNVLIGKNGSGKSTVLRSISNLLTKEFKNLEKEPLEKFEIVFNNGEVIGYPRNPEYLDMEFNAEFISTFDIDISDRRQESGKAKDVINTELDSEIEKHIGRFNKLIGDKQVSFESNKDKNLDPNCERDKLIDFINYFFKETGKTDAKFKGNKIEFHINGTTIDTAKLSTGEKQILIILVQIYSQLLNLKEEKVPCFILMDEPENSLHLELQEQIIDTAREINDKTQIIIVTHSPGIVKNGWWDKAIGMHEILKEA